jgi:hypothetical protein
MAYRRWSHLGIRIESERSDFRACPLDLIGYHVPVNVKRGLDVAVPHELLLHRDGSPHAVKPTAVGVAEGVSAHSAEPGQS